MESDLTNNIKPEITAAYLKSTTKISGWLTFFLVAMILGGLVSAIYPIATLNMADYNNSVILASGDIIVGILLLALAIYTLYAFLQRRPDAVFSAKTYVVTAFSINLFALIISKATDTEIDDFRGISGIIRSLIWTVIWFAYLCLSDQVETVIPSSYRKIFMHNYIFIASLSLLPIFLITLGFLSGMSVAASHQAEVEENLKNLVLQENERTDGVIVFTMPDGFQCTEEDAEGTKIFSLKGEVEKAALFSVYDNDASESLFDDYWNAFKNSDLNQYLDNVETDEISTVNGYKYRYRLTKYESIGTFYWRFVAIYDNNKSNACLLSFYDMDQNNFLMLLNSIRFL
ncbi:MAG: DUF2569 family protein [Bacteroidales bacterium]|nr:DUF2569 family protein [Bacteroidales bacterium]